ncbi:hypothetical protein HanXRQr2_Chr09g0386081 [Helianthus annuus]|uniref:Uncharacterized protein n=1 Tax=Helianthus annuus TaxID=4232 RepID=A0A9K3I5B2_HELAN|nr:hypothetical protein HanXRQr2_Chr09g0386081 [Helianthus annuus]KAJ0892950.1 hypothetical protein HanPSC8_Chr09g0372061 [Helianthus annuus]
MSRRSFPIGTTTTNSATCRLLFIRTCFPRFCRHPFAPLFVSSFSSSCFHWLPYTTNLWFRHSFLIHSSAFSFLAFQIRRNLSILFNISFGIFNFCSLFLLRNRLGSRIYTLRLGSKIYVTFLWPYFIRNKEF